jgi:hypothetical protein
MTWEYAFVLPADGGFDLKEAPAAHHAGVLRFKRRARVRALAHSTVMQHK